MASASAYRHPALFPLSSSDLWVIPPAEQSRWFSHIDWYLNWQLCRGLAREKLKPSVELFRVLEETGIRYVEQEVEKSSPLMVAAEGRLPAALCVVVAREKTLKSWLSSVRKMSAKLNARSLRIFLPTGAKHDEAVEIWRSFSAHDIEIEFSLDEVLTI
jgi:hypothetical protein